MCVFAFLNDHQLSNVSGTIVKPLSVAQARDELMTRKYRGWQKLWQSGTFATACPHWLMLWQLGFCTHLLEIGMQRQLPATTKICFMLL
jgi:hypothetical protein